MSLTCKHCDCDNFREELMGNVMMVSNEGNCKNCQHPVNAHPRSSAAQPHPLAAANIVTASAVSMNAGDLVKNGINVKNGCSGREELITPHYGQEQGHQTVPSLRSIPLDHSGSHIAQYDPKQGGYVTNTGSVANNECTQGNYNNDGLTGPGVNGTVQSTASVAYGGAYNSQYEGGYYSAKRVGTSCSAPEAQSVEVKVVTSSSPSTSTTTSGEFDYDAVRAQYGSGYSAKR